MTQMLQDVIVYGTGYNANVGLAEEGKTVNKRAALIPSHDEVSSHFNYSDDAISDSVHIGCVSVDQKLIGGS